MALDSHSMVIWYCEGNIVRVSFPRGRKKKFSHQLSESLETDLLSVCHILLVRDVTWSNQIQEGEDLDFTS